MIAIELIVGACGKNGFRITETERKWTYFFFPEWSLEPISNNGEQCTQKLGIRSPFLEIPSAEILSVGFVVNEILRLSRLESN